MSLFSLREFHSKYVVCVYLYDNGGELVLASNHTGTLAPLFAREFVTRASMDDAFFFEDIAPEIKNLLSDVSEFVKGESVSFFIALASRALSIDLIEVKHRIEDIRVVSQFKKEYVWELQKKDIMNRIQSEGRELFEFHILHETFSNDHHPEYRAHIAYGGMPRRMLGEIQSLRRMIKSLLPQSSSMLISKQVLLSYLHESFFDDKGDRLFVDFDKHEITVLGVIGGVSSLYIHKAFDVEHMIQTVIDYLHTDFETFRRMIDLEKMGLLEEGKSLKLLSGMKKALEDPVYALLKKGHEISLSEFVIASEITTTCFNEAFSGLCANAFSSLVLEYYGLVSMPRVKPMKKELRLFDQFKDKRILDVLVVFNYLAKRAI